MNHTVGRVLKPRLYNLHIEHDLQSPFETSDPFNSGDSHYQGLPTGTTQEHQNVAYVQRHDDGH